MKLELLQKKYLAYLQAHSFVGEPENLYEPINYIMNLGGKRIRPVLSMAAGLAFDAPVNDTLRLAHAIETFHNFTLVHDDIMDEAESRRGKQTVHIRNGLPTAILAGDNMLILAFQMFEGCRPDVLSVFLKAAQEVSNGQQMDMNFEESSDVTMLDYLEMIRLKTAVLLGCSCYVGAANAGADSETSHKMYAFAEQMGMAFQMQDDWLDTFGSKAETGKTEGGDIISKKKMWLYLKAREKENTIDDIYTIEDPTLRVKESREYFKQLGLDKELLAEQDKYYQKSLEILTSLNLGDDKMLPFLEIASFLKNRKH